MNRLFVIFCILLVFGISGCNSDNDNWYEYMYFDSSQLEQNNVFMSIQNISNGGLSFYLENISNNVYTYGEHYTLYVQTNNVWKSVKPIIKNGAFFDIGYTLQPHSTTDLITIDWRWLYGNIPNGKYKFVKNIIYMRDTYLVAYDFILP